MRYIKIAQRYNEEQLRRIAAAAINLLQYSGVNLTESNIVINGFFDHKGHCHFCGSDSFEHIEDCPIEIIERAVVAK